jgi:hypothetical protein
VPTIIGIDAKAIPAATHFTTAMQLLDDFWREVKRLMTEKGIPNDL